MAGGIVTVGRRQYACGLYWENSPSGRVSQAAKEAARQPEMQAAFYAARAGNKGGRVPQFGLSQESGEYRAGLPVLAACLANQQPGSWAGAFRLREGVALVVVRDDLIVPDGDLFFQDENEARDRLLQEMAMGGLQKVYAPETWGVSGSDSMPVSLLLNDYADVKLHAVEMSRSTIMFIVASVGILLLLLGVGMYIQKRNAEAEAARLALLDKQRRAMEEAKRAMTLVPQAPVYPEPIKVWEKKPQPLALIGACKETLKLSPYVVAGWHLESVKCDEGGLHERWARTGSFSIPPPNSTLDDSAKSAALTIPLSVSVTPRGSEELKDPEEITLRYLTQNWPGTLKRIKDDPPPPPPPNYKGTWNPPPPPWIKRSFTLSAPVLPWTLPTFFEDLPGVVINTLSYNLKGKGGSWTIDGVIYENRRR